VKVSGQSVQGSFVALASIGQLQIIMKLSNNRPRDGQADSGRDGAVGEPLRGHSPEGGMGFGVAVELFWVIAICPDNPIRLPINNY
jgi:hypothetical protein